MFSRTTGIALIFLLMAFVSRPVRADDTEMKLRELEARLVYEAASQLVMDGEYDKAIRRFDRIIWEYPETEYAGLAVGRKSEVARLRLQPKPISGTSRASLVGFGTLFTTWLGIGTLILGEVDTTEPYGVALIAGPTGGLAGSLMLTRDMKLSDAQASLINLGGVWGIWQATGAALVADASEKSTVGASMAGGIAGLAVSSSIVRGRNITPGGATMISFGGIWGTWFALCGAMLADLDDGDDVLTSSMIGGDVGLLTMAVVSSKVKMSRSRARFINIGGIIGTLYGLGTNVLLEIDSKRDFWSVLGVGSVLGLAAGTYLTRNYDAEKGYFAEGMVSHSVPGRGGQMDFPNAAFLRSHGVYEGISGIKLQIPLFTVTF